MRIGRALVAYLTARGAADTQPGIVERLQYNEGRKSQNEDELREVLALFEARVGQPAVVAFVQRSPQSLIGVRLHRIRSFLTIVDALVGPDQANKVMRETLYGSCQMTPFSTRDQASVSASQRSSN